MTLNFTEKKRKQHPNVSVKNQERDWKRKRKFNQTKKKGNTVMQFSFFYKNLLRKTTFKKIHGSNTFS